MIQNIQESYVRITYNYIYIHTHTENYICFFKRYLKYVTQMYASDNIRAMRAPAGLFETSFMSLFQEHRRSISVSSSQTDLARSLTGLSSWNCFVLLHLCGGHHVAGWTLCFLSPTLAWVLVVRVWLMPVLQSTLAVVLQLMHSSYCIGYIVIFVLHSICMHGI